jgi:hypothetical protein
MHRCRQLFLTIGKPSCEQAEIASSWVLCFPRHVEWANALAMNRLG